MLYFVSLFKDATLPSECFQQFVSKTAGFGMLLVQFSEGKIIAKLNVKIYNVAGS